MIIGEQAVLRYGEPRLTKDIDISLGIDIDRLDELLLIVEELFLTPLPEDVPSFVQKTIVLQGTSVAGIQFPDQRQIFL